MDGHERPGSDQTRGPLAAWTSDARNAIGFFTRLPPPFAPRHHAAPAFARASRAVPIAGLVVGLVGAAVLLALSGFGVPVALTVTLTLAALIAATGALHEDGLADVADGFGGGASRARKLEIMRDSRVGTFGVAALVISVLARFSALTAILEQGGAFATAGVIVAAAAVSRMAGVSISAATPHARPDGAAAATGRPRPRAILQGWAIAVAAALLLGGPAVGIAATLLGCVLAGLAAVLLGRLAMRQIGGHTGDVIGAGQQAAELAFLVAASISVEANAL
jgi:adenosylcobinamide-GDP ribazoletransferase